MSEPQQTSHTHPAVIFLFGLAAVGVGLFMACLELWHASHNVHPLSTTNVLIGMGIAIVGALIIQSGNVAAALEVAKEAIPALASRIPGGRRASDPPADDGQPEVIEPDIPRKPTPVTVQPTRDHDREPVEAADPPHEPHQWRDGDPREGVL